MVIHPSPTPPPTHTPLLPLLLTLQSVIVFLVVDLQAQNVAEGRSARQSRNPKCDKNGNVSEQAKANRRAGTLAFRNGKLRGYFEDPKIVALHSNFCGKFHPKLNTGFILSGL